MDRSRRLPPLYRAGQESRTIAGLASKEAQRNGFIPKLDAYGGLSFIAMASRLKNVPASICATWMAGFRVNFTFGSTGMFVGDVYGFPTDERRQPVLVLNRDHRREVIRRERDHKSRDEGRRQRAEDAGLEADDQALPNVVDVLVSSRAAARRPSRARRLLLHRPRLRSTLRARRARLKALLTPRCEVHSLAIVALVIAPVAPIGGESNGTVLATRPALTGSYRPVPRARSAAQETVVRRAAAPAHARSLWRKVDRRQ